MGCWHGWHGCGPWYGPPHGQVWYPADWYEKADRPPGRRYRRGRLSGEEAAEELEARLLELRDEMRRVHAEIRDLRSAGASAGEGQ